MDEKMGCDICGEIPINYNLTDKYMRNALVKSGIKKWLLCDECIVIVDGFVNNLQASRPNEIVDNWPTMESIDKAGQAAAIERQSRIAKKPKKSAYARKADFDDLERRVWKMFDDYRELRKKVESIDKKKEKKAREIEVRQGIIDR